MSGGGSRRRRPKEPRSQQVSLDQLLGDVGEWVPEEPKRRMRWWVRDPIVALVVAFGIAVFMRALSFVAPYPVLAATVFTALLLRRALLAVPVPAPPRAVYSDVWGTIDDPGPRFAPVDGVARAVERWAARFDWTERDASRFTSAVHPRLYELVEERLRQRHGMTMGTDPTRARALMGEQLWTFLHARVARTPSVREMTEIVGDMEKI
jgi:hypothetical protein